VSPDKNGHHHQVHRDTVTAALALVDEAESLARRVAELEARGCTNCAGPIDATGDCPECVAQDARLHARVAELEAELRTVRSALGADVSSAPLYLVASDLKAERDAAKDKAGQEQASAMHISMRAGQIERERDKLRTQLTECVSLISDAASLLGAYDHAKSSGTRDVMEWIVGEVVSLRAERDRLAAAVAKAADRVRDIANEASAAYMNSVSIGDLESVEYDLRAGLPEVTADGPRKVTKP
jgi:hypothetical protein